MNIKEITELLKLMNIDHNISIDCTDVYTITFPHPLLVRKGQ